MASRTRAPFADRVLVGDALTVLRTVPSACAQCVMTSPPYWGLRDYGVRGQIGLEPTVEAWVRRLVTVFQDVRRLLRDDGTLWLNVGDAYAGASARRLLGDGGAIRRRAAISSVTRPVPAGLGPKQLLGLPWRLALALQADGWILRSDIVWAKPNALPESVRDRPTRSHEYVFLFAKRPRYFFDQDAIREPVTGGAHARGRGVTPKSRPPGQGIRANASFHAAVSGLVALRNARSVWATPAPYRSGNRARRLAGPTRLNDHRGTSIPWQDDGSGRNARSVWAIPTRPFRGAHFATFPEALAERCIRASSRPGDLVLDPFCGSGTALAVARWLERRFLGIELKQEYARMARKRILLLEGKHLSAGNDSVLALPLGKHDSPVGKSDSVLRIGEVLGAE